MLRRKLFYILFMIILPNKSTLKLQIGKNISKKWIKIITTANVFNKSSINKYQASMAMSITLMTISQLILWMYLKEKPYSILSAPTIGCTS